MYLPPESMQQIAFALLLMMSLACVHGILNTAAGDGMNGAAPPEDENVMKRRRDFDDYDGEINSKVLNFRQNEFISFTAEDATPMHGSSSSPSYWNAKPTTTPHILHSPAGGNRGAAMMMTSPDSRLQTQPILSYRDPYSDEELYYTPMTAATPLRSLPREAATQEYTVQSSLLVGANQQQQQQSHYDFVRRQQDASSNQRRPGLVFDESPRPPQSAAPSYTGAPPNYVRPHVEGTQQGFTRPYPPPPSTDDWQPHGQHEQSNYLPYKSQDYPTPTYQQRPQNFQLPQRQDAAPANYANGYGNYLPSAPLPQRQREPAQHYQPGRPLYALQRPGWPAGPVDKNYLEYQAGEIPPPPPRPTPPQLPSPPRRQSTASSAPRPVYEYGGHNRPPIIAAPPPTRPAQSALANLVSLFSGTQQYAPQFTNLLLGTLTGGGGGGGSAIRPPNMQLIKALENIARNDDLQCVPKVVCQMIAARTERGELPNFVTSPAITNFLAGFPASSPAIIYGRAALLGISGGDKSCSKTYSQCPKNEYEILYYLNNHRGGFFKFFSEPAEAASQHNDHDQHGGSSGAGGGGNSILSILGALTGGNFNGGAANVNKVVKPKPTRPPPSNMLSSGLDITNSIGNFFTQAVSNYFSDVDYQRRRRRRSLDSEMHDDISKVAEKDDEEDNLDTDSNDDADENVDNVNDIPGIESRILHKNALSGLTELTFFPEQKANADEEEYDLQDALLRQVIEKFNKSKKNRQVKFPLEEDNESGSTDSHLVTEIRPLRGRDHKQIVFQDSYQYHKENGQFSEKPANANLIKFPNHSTKIVRNGRILNRPDYTTSHEDDRDKFVLSNDHRNENFHGGSAATSSAHLTSSFSSSQNSHSYYSHGLHHSGTSYSDSPSTISRPSTYTTNSNKQYNNNNRYQTTRRPPPPPREDDKNVYVTNSQGVTEYYLTPEGRKVYL